MKLINTDLIQRVLYSTDISLYEMLPTGVATPRTEQEVKKILDICIQKGISVTPRGSGTSTAGQAIGDGIIIDYSKFMNNLLIVGKDYVDVQPGIILADLNEQLKKQGIFFPVDPSSMEVCTIGGMVGNNSSGIHSFLYGDTKDYVVGLEGFWADGKFFSTITGLNIDATLQKLLPFKNRAKEAQKHLPLTSKNSSGYNIVEAFSDYGISINHLATGSEGTLCVITKIRLKVIPLPNERVTVLSVFDKLEKALEAVSLAKTIKGVSAIELLDKELIDITRKLFTEFNTMFDGEVNAGLLFEVEGDSLELERILSLLAIRTDVATSDETRKRLWWFRKSAGPLLNRIQGSTRSLRFIEDVAVPFEKIMEFYKEEKKILDTYGLRTAFFGHIGSGHFHINPRVDTRDPESQKMIADICKKTYELAKKLGGTFSAEHGDGMLREPYIRELQPELYQLFYQIKETLDPKWTLNPGKIVSKDKKEAPYRYNFTPCKDATNTIVNAVEKCHGCHDCTHFCKALNIIARDRANIMRNIVNGVIADRKEIQKATRYIEKCKQCGKCLLECPTGVDLLETASLLREYGIIEISTIKKVTMKLLSPLKSLLEHELDLVKNDTEFKVNKIFNTVFRLGLYYKPYTRKILELVKQKKLSLVLRDKDLQNYLTSRT